VTGLVPTYRRTGSALHATRSGIAAAYICAPCAVAILFDNPIVLGAALASVIVAGVAAGLGAELARSARFALPLALLVMVVNPLVSREGLTLLVQGPVWPVLGRIDITLEALVYGAVAGLRVLVLVLAFGLYSAAVDPDDVLRFFRRISLRSSLTASLATRLVPLLGRDAQRLGDAYPLRAARPAPGRRFARLQRGAVLTRALAAGALERSVDLAAALEVRGYLSASPIRTRGAPWSLHDFTFAFSALVLMALIITAGLAGVAGFEPYPLIDIDAGGATIALSLSILALMLLPFVVARISQRRRFGRDSNG
jgi:energy-coupling factor transport system permease protein